MNKLRKRCGEMLLESLISMLIIAMTGMMLAMAAASAIQANAQGEQTVTFADTSSGGAATAYPADTDGEFDASLGDINMGKVTVKTQGGLYYYEPKTG